MGTFPFSQSSWKERTVLTESQLKRLKGDNPETWALTNTICCRSWNTIQIVFQKMIEICNSNSRSGHKVIANNTDSYSEPENMALELAVLEDEPSQSSAGRSLWGAASALLFLALWCVLLPAGPVWICTFLKHWSDPPFWTGIEVKLWQLKLKPLAFSILWFWVKYVSP